MKAFHLSSSSSQNVLILNLYPRELLLETIISYLKENQIKNSCVISGIGTLKRLSFHRILTTEEKPKDEYITLEGPFELSSTQGLIINYEPHLHFVASDLKNTYSGHLEYNSQVLYLAEFTLLTLDSQNHNLARKVKENNISFIEEV